MNELAQFGGSFVGTLMIIWLLEWAVLKRFIPDNKWRVLLGTTGGGIGALVLYGFGNADGGPWNPWPEGLYYIVAAMIILPIRLWVRIPARQNV